MARALRVPILPTNFQWHVGIEVNFIGKQERALDPGQFSHQLGAWTGKPTTNVLSPD
ncbi:hypothetical protein [Mycolicibacterium hippocampi]|uniref:Uncharacterized protein n=1 Tax=Mycolicibacterium hippocampi TaxID=659824 RepID=A0A7I9ZIU9_9MYCO|nr:hypothetical protein [Mycolicibacterium hippocampi]GFH00528.1 hypothetical protein MHIP_10110 [Mycolicibacterium hippocampi]